MVFLDQSPTQSPTEPYLVVFEAAEALQGWWLIHFPFSSLLLLVLMLPSANTHPTLSTNTHPILPFF